MTSEVDGKNKHYDSLHTIYILIAKTMKKIIV
jgi:hypothetical protein